MTNAETIEETGIDLEYWSKMVKHNTPGRFEGEDPWVPYFFDQIMNGDGEDFITEEDDNPPITLFEPDVNEREAFEVKEIVLIMESNQGFIFGVQFDTREEAEAWIQEYNS